LIEAVLPDRRRDARPRGERGSRDDWLDAVAVLSGRKERIRSRVWRGGRVTAIMGGVDIDLRDAAPAAEGAVLHVTVIMGGVDVRVPENWQVTLAGTPLLGGFDDKTRGGGESGPVLTIRGSAVMGGVDVKN
jgi:hypothetical protein